MAVPTTAGSGSEATGFAVVYYHDEKYSIKDESCIPQTVLLIPELLNTLPEYHRKASMLDVLCHGIESFWSVNATNESREYSRKAIKMVYEYADKYIANENEGNHMMLKASHIAGKAINISQTTAGHAMCYKLTKLYGLAHGFAASMCVESLWFYMLEAVESRDDSDLQKVFEELAEISGVSTAKMAAEKFSRFIRQFTPKICLDTKDIKLLSKSVNAERLNNNPILLEYSEIKNIYRNIMKIYRNGECVES